MRGSKAKNPPEVELQDVHAVLHHTCVSEHAHSGLIVRPFKKAFCKYYFACSYGVEQSLFLTIHCTDAVRLCWARDSDTTDAPLELEFYVDNKQL